MFSNKFSRTTRTLSVGMPIFGAVLLCMMLVSPAQAARAIVTKIALAYGNTTPGGEKLSGTVSDALSGVKGSGVIVGDNYLDTKTTETMDFSAIPDSDHTQTIVRSHPLADGSVRIFIAHADGTNEGKSFRMPGGVLLGYEVPSSVIDSSSGLFKQSSSTFPEIMRKNLDQTPDNSIFQAEIHPSSMAWLPDSSKPTSNGGYLFTTSEYNANAMYVYYWNNYAPSNLELVAKFNFSDSTRKQLRYVSIIKHKGTYRLMIGNAGYAEFYQASPVELFNGRDRLNFDAFRLTNAFTYNHNDYPFIGYTFGETKGRRFGENVSFIQDKDENLFLIGYDGQASTLGLDKAFVHPVVIENDNSIKVSEVNFVEIFGKPAGGTLASNCEAGCSHWVSKSGVYELQKVAHYADIWNIFFTPRTSINARHR